jgi:Ca2+-binding RTX toxin-like protein
MINFYVTSEAELRDALNAANIGDQIFVNAASLNIKESLLIPDGISIFGNECKIYSTAVSVFDLGSSVGVKINGFHVDLESGRGVVGNGCQNILIENCKITGTSLSTGMSYISVDIYGGNGMIIRGNIIEETIGGIYVVNCSNVCVSDNALGRVSYGNLVISGTNIEVLDNKIKDPGYPNNEGRYNGDGMTLEIENGLVARNNVSGGFCYNVAVDNSFRVTFEDNQIENGVTGGLYVTNSNSLTVKNNSFINNAFIGFFGVSDIVFDSNYLAYNSLYVDRQISFVANGNVFYGVKTPIIGLIESGEDNFSSYPDGEQQTGIRFYNDVFMGVPFGEFVEYSLPGSLIEYPSENFYRYSIPSDSTMLFQYNGASNKLAGVFDEDIINLQFVIYVDVADYLTNRANFKFVPQSVNFSDHASGVTVLNVSNVEGSKFDDILISGIKGATLRGGLGSDQLYGSPGNDQLYGEDGYDWISYASSEVAVTVSLPFEVAYSVNEIDGVYGVEGVEGSYFDDLLLGLSGVDNHIKGLTGDDVIFGFGGNDTLDGGLGNDTLDGGLDNDTLDGGLGNDVLLGGPGSDQLYGGDGYDWISYASSEVAVTVSLPFEVAYSVNEIDGVYGVEGVEGSNFDDLLLGLSGVDNYIKGLTGDDVIFGFGGNDTLDGGLGNDVLYGGLGNDVLYGGLGNDVFVFDVLESSVDIIFDFDVMEDKIFISGRDSIPNEVSFYSGDYESTPGMFIADQGSVFVFLSGWQGVQPVEGIFFI